MTLVASCLTRARRRVFLLGSHATQAHMELATLLDRMHETLEKGSPEPIHEAAAKCLRYCTMNVHADPELFVYCMKVADLAMFSVRDALSKSTTGQATLPSFFPRNG